ncbi:hypothetical protein [Providencia rettgeri]|uniref:hypothetical protein n=1 Tax=Providencia rettgeri TaxID=587 RepID=UPI00235DF73D|nr:hypothetical protein [Providencia rettgeri]
MQLYQSFKLELDHELVKLIEENEPKENEVAIVIDSSGVTGIDTREFYKFLKSHHENVRVYGDTSNVSYISLNSLIISIGTVFVTTAVVPIFLNLVSNFIQKQMDKRNTKDLELRCTIVKKSANGNFEEINLSGDPDYVLKAIEKIRNE